MAAIVNRVAKSPLVTVDLEALRPSGVRHLIDMTQWLEEGWILREKVFRQALADHNWAPYADQTVAVFCSSEAILPAWAALLVTTYLNKAKQVVWGDSVALEHALYLAVIEDLKEEDYADKPLIIKGCSDPSIPQSAYLALIRKLQPIAKSLFFGEACSSVPLYKAKK